MKKEKRIKLRATWEINPRTRIKESKKEYKREKFDWRKELDNED